jgi:hypothetical protein
VLVRDRLELGLRRLEVVDAERLPHLRFPGLVGGLRTVRVLVVSEAEGNHHLGIAVGQGLVEVLARLVVVVRVLLAGPVVRVAHTKDGSVDLGQVAELAGLDALPELATVLREFSLTGDRGEEGDVGLERQVLERHVVECESACGDAARASASGKLLGELLAVAAVGREEDEKRRALERTRESVKGLASLALLRRDELRSGTGLEGVAKGRQASREFGEVVLTVEERAQVGLDLLRVELEHLATPSVGRRVPPVQRPRTDLDRLLGLLEELERRDRVVLAAGKVREDNRRALVRIRLGERAQGLGEVAVDSDRSDVCVTVGHGVQAGILAALCRQLVGREVVRRGVDHEEVDVCAGRKSVVETGSAEVV